MQIKPYPLPYLYLCDFENVLGEETDEQGRLVVTGTLAGKAEKIRALFPRQSGPKGNWKSSAQWEIIEG